MLSVRLPASCENSPDISVDIPHDGIKRVFKKVGRTPRGRSPSPTSAPYSYWEGLDDQDGSTFAFVQDEEGNMMGSLVDLTNHNVLQFQKQPDGSSAVTITASNDFPPEGDPHKDAFEGRNLFETSSTTRQDSSSSASSPTKETTMTNDKVGIAQTNHAHSLSRKLYDDNGGNLDVMVVWTAKSECRNYGLSAGCTLSADTESSMLARINLAISETNAAYAATGINTELLLVHAYRHPTYVETSFSSSLSEIRSGSISGVRANRSTYGADLVALIIDDSAYCGLAYIGPSSLFMYSVTAWNCATGYYSFGHEIGHNLGLWHDRGTSHACRTSNYNYGYRDPSGNFRTVLAYSCRTGQCDNNSASSCTRINRYSTPDYTWTGLPLGTSGENNSQAINDVRVEVAGYYTHVTTSTGSPTASPVASPTSSPTSSPVTSPTSSPVASPSSCSNTSGTFTVGGKSRTCAWVEKKNTARRCTKAAVEANCPVTCGLCSVPTTAPVSSPVSTPSSCSNTSGTFLVGGNSRTCAWVEKKNTVKRCKKAVVQANCPVSCDLCGGPAPSPVSSPSSCIDSTDTFTVAGKSRTCAWAAKNNTAKRCRKAPVLENCPVTCDSC